MESRLKMKNVIYEGEFEFEKLIKRKNIYDGERMKKEE